MGSYGSFRVASGRKPFVSGMKFVISVARSILHLFSILDDVGITTETQHSLRCSLVPLIT